MTGFGTKAGQTAGALVDTFWEARFSTTGTFSIPSFLGHPNLNRFDASGNILEHYSDGDLVNEDTPWGRELEAPDSLYIWGPNIPLGFITAKVEDAGKVIPKPSAPMLK
jgi:hypothetical protein